MCFVPLPLCGVDRAANAPRSSDWQRTQFAADLTSGQSHNRGKGWVCNFELRQALDGTVSLHKHCDQMDDLHGLLANHVCSQNSMGFARDDQLTAALGTAVDHGPIKV